MLHFINVTPQRPASEARPTPGSLARRTEHPWPVYATAQRPAQPELELGNGAAQNILVGLIVTHAYDTKQSGLLSWPVHCGARRPYDVFGQQHSQSDTEQRRPDERVEEAGTQRNCDRQHPNQHSGDQTAIVDE